MKRSKWKGPLIKLKDLKKKLLVLPRNSEITSQLVGFVCSVHSGKKVVKLSLTNEMVGYKIGEFVATREKFEFKKKKKNNF